MIPVSKTSPSRCGALAPASKITIRRGLQHEHSHTRESRATDRHACPWPSAWRLPRRRGPLGATQGTPPQTAAQAEGDAKAEAAKKAAASEPVKDLAGVTVTSYRASLREGARHQARQQSARSTRSWPRTSPTSRTSTWPNRCSASPAWRSPATPAKAATSPCAASDSHFTRVRINGMEALTTTGGTDSSGGANRGRGFDFNVFASELFNNITVRKTASADVEEGSLGATVDLQRGASVRLRRLHLASRPAQVRLQRPVRRLRSARRRC